MHVANKICLSYVTNIPKVMGLACGTFVVSYLKTLDMPFLRLFFLKLRTDINGTVTLKQYITLHGSKMYPQTKYGIPILHEIRNARALETVSDALRHQDVFK